MKWFFILFFSTLSYGNTFQERVKQLKAEDNLAEFIYSYLDETASEQTQPLVLLETCKKSIWRKAKGKKEQLAFVYFWANYAFHLKKEGFLQQSAKAYQKAWQIFTTNQLNDFEIYESCLKPLANIYTRLGDYEKAINTHQLILKQAEDSDNESLKTGTLINIAIIYHDLGKIHYAIKLLMQAKDAKKLAKLHHLLIYAKLAKYNLLLNNIEKAKEYTAKINAKTAYEKAFYYKLKAAINQKEQQFDKAIYFWNLAIEQLIKNNTSKREIAKTYLKLASTYQSNANYNKALNYCEKALKTLVKFSSFDKDFIYPENTFKEIFDLEAILLIKQKKYKKALVKLDFAFYTDELLRKTFSYQESKLFLQNELQKRTELAIKTSLKTGNKTKAFWYAQNNKSITLSNEYFFNSMKNNYATDSLIIREKQLKQLVTKIKAKHNNFLAYYNKIIDELAQTRTLINKKYHLEVPKNSSLKAIQQELKKENSTLMLFFEGNENSYYFTVNATALIVTNYKNDSTIYDFIKRFEKYNLLEENFDAYKTSAYKLYKQFGFAKISTKKLIIIPDGSINALPFEALLTKETKNNSFSKLPYLLLKHEITYAYSPNLYFNQKNKITKAAKLLGIAPIFKNSANYLKYASLELAAIQKEAKGLYLSNDKATKKTFVAQAEYYDAIHISSHATSTNTPYIQFKDSIITLDEIYGLSLKANLVVLSACKTGSGKIQKGEGTLSLGRGFKYAGSASIIQSLWQVNDKATALLMRSFYKNLNAKTSKTAALHQAKLGYLNNKNIKNLKKSPYYWAAFQYYGSNDTLVFQKPKTTNILYYIIASTALLTILFFTIKYKK